MRVFKDMLRYLNLSSIRTAVAAMTTRAPDYAEADLEEATGTRSRKSRKRLADPDSKAMARYRRKRRTRNRIARASRRINRRRAA